MIFSLIVPHQDESCHYDKSCSSAEVTGYTDVTSEDEEALKEAAASVGPISVAIDASHMSFQLYESGKPFDLEE